jgi:hypothetical protein
MCPPKGQTPAHFSERSSRPIHVGLPRSALLLRAHYLSVPICCGGNGKLPFKAPFRRPRVGAGEMLRAGSTTPYNVKYLGEQDRLVRTWAKFPCHDCAGPKTMRRGRRPLTPSSSGWRQRSSAAVIWITTRQLTVLLVLLTAWATNGGRCATFRRVMTSAADPPAEPAYPGGREHPHACQRTQTQSAYRRGGRQ